ncbi:hypothetical protein BV898_01160 [Hypsibius exemplaris]|uniref:Uncharacterized protein n=1 Tax=Hypsibius exemplaris TaxID=2072580 RepID=A0A1W0XBY8_HYPEX|nr:hypothetical protein BV898_01160 [Hypsibius exemplaris]
MSFGENGVRKVEPNSGRNLTSRASCLWPAFALVEKPQSASSNPERNQHGARPAQGGRYPTMMTVIPGTVWDAGVSLVALLDHVKWHSVALILDLNSGSADAGRIQGRSTSLLTALHKRSRVIICETLHQPLRQLATAYDLDMTTRNEYVFLYVYILQIPTERPAEWHENDQLDKKVKAVFGSTLVIRTGEPKWEEIDGIMERIIRRGSEMFNETYDKANKFNEFAVGCYGSVELLISTLNNTYLAGGSTKLNSPAEFLRSLKNRTIQLTFERYVFLPDGTRAPNMVLQRFDTASARFQVRLQTSSSPKRRHA